MDGRVMNTGKWNEKHSDSVLLEIDCSKCGRITRARIRADLMARYGNGTPLEELFDEPEQLAYLNDGLCRKCFNLENQRR
jgi:hypothetical protein